MHQARHDVCPSAFSRASPLTFARHIHHLFWFTAFRWVTQRSALATFLSMRCWLGNRFEGRKVGVVIDILCLRSEGNRYPVILGLSFW